MPPKHRAIGGAGRQHVAHYPHTRIESSATVPVPLFGNSCLPRIAQDRLRLPNVPPIRSPRAGFLKFGMLTAAHRTLSSAPVETGFHLAFSDLYDLSRCP